MSKVGMLFLGAFAAYGFNEVKKYLEDRRRRKLVATALLFELRPLERMLRKRAVHTRAASSSVRISMPVHDRFEAELLLFPAQSLQVLLSLRAWVRDMEHAFATFHEPNATIDDRANQYMRGRAIGAANLIPVAVDVLKKCGGQLTLVP